MHIVVFCGVWVGGGFCCIFHETLQTTLVNVLLHMQTRLIQSGCGGYFQVTSLHAIIKQIFLIMYKMGQKTLQL